MELTALQIFLNVVAIGTIAWWAKNTSDRGFWNVSVCGCLLIALVAPLAGLRGLNVLLNAIGSVGYVYWVGWACLESTRLDDDGRKWRMMVIPFMLVAFFGSNHYYTLHGGLFWIIPALHLGIATVAALVAALFGNLR